MSKLRTVIRWAAANGMLDVIPAMKIGVPVYRKFRPPTPEEAKAIYAAAAEHVRRSILLGGTEGLRVGESELFALRWDNVFLNGNEDSYLLIDTSRKKKSQPMRAVPIQKELVSLMRQWFTEDKARGIEYVISYRGHPIQSIKTAWKATLRRAGITGYFRPYDLRHAFATNLIVAGWDYGTVADLWGTRTNCSQALSICLYSPKTPSCICPPLTLKCDMKSPCALGTSEHALRAHNKAF